MSEFITKKNQDSAFVQYIKQSNARCRNTKPFICCPFEFRATPPTEPIDQTYLQGRLLTVEEGCGFSNVTHLKLIAGNVSKPGRTEICSTWQI